MSLLKGIKNRLSKLSDLMLLKSTENTSGGEVKRERVKSLTPREMDVFLLLLEGFTLNETAIQLGIKYSTVNTNMTAVYRKLCVNSRPELIIHYKEFSKCRDNGLF